MASKTTNTIRFNFIGTLVTPKNGFLTETDSKFGTGKTSRLNFGIKVGTNTEFCGLLDSPKDTIFSVDTDGDQMNIAWDDRTDPEVLAKIANYRKFRTNVGCEEGEIKEFAAGYDFIHYLANHLNDSGDQLNVSGTLSIRYDNKNTLRHNYNINSVWVRRPNEKGILGLLVPLTYWKDCVDKSDLKETGKITINGYVLQYINKEEGSKYLPISTVFDTTVYDMDNPNKKKAYEYKMPFVDIAKKTPHTMLWDVRVVNGAPEVEFDESQLTKMQRIQIELGEATLDDFRPRGQIYGSRISELRLCKPVFRDDFKDDMVDTGYKVSEFEDMIYTPTPKEESVADMEKSAASPTPKSDDAPPFEDDAELF